jgi:hypothetical protein
LQAVRNGASRTRTGDLLGAILPPRSSASATARVRVRAASPVRGRRSRVARSSSSPWIFADRSADRKMPHVIVRPMLRAFLLVTPERREQPRSTRLDRCLRTEANVRASGPALPLGTNRGAKIVPSSVAAFHAKQQSALSSRRPQALPSRVLVERGSNGSSRRAPLLIDRPWAEVAEVIDLVAVVLGEHFEARAALLGD